MNHEIKVKTKLLKDNGTLNEPGFAKKMQFIYNRDCVRSVPFKLKEWDFYQFICGEYALQFTLGHVSYMGQMAVTLINLKTGEKWDYSTMKPFFIPDLDLNPETQSFCEYKGKHCYLSYEVHEKERHLIFTGIHPEHGEIEVDLSVDNDVNNEKLVIATPFKKPTQFYLNYKENYYKANGFARFGDKYVPFENATGLLDWGRGVWPYSHEWYWGNLSSHIDGVPFGFNIGWGFGNTHHATENMYFYNKKAYKIGKIVGKWDDNDLMAVKHFHDKEHKLELTFTPFYNNHTENKFVVVDTQCDQVYGYFSGTIRTDDGIKEFKNVVAFIEHAVNKW